MTTRMAPERATPKWLLLLQELRAPFFSASAMPVLLGTALAYAHTGICNWPLFVWSMLGLLLINATANVANDYFDHHSGNDAANTEYVRPFTGGSRMIQRGLLTPRDLLVLTITCGCLAVCAIAYLSWRVGPIILAFGAVGLVSGILYTAPGANLVGRGWGECTIGLNVGILPVVGAYYVQTQTWSWLALVLSLPMAILIAAILFINQFQDYHADKAVGKHHWVVRLGRRRAVVLHALLMTGWAVPILAAILAGTCPPLCALALLALVPAGLSIWIAARHYDHPAQLTPANVLTIVTDLGVGLLLSGTLVAQKLWLSS